MAKSQVTSRPRGELASIDNAKSILGNIDDAKLLDIMTLRPSTLDIEQASAWLGGDRDIFGAGRPLNGLAGEIAAILTADEDEAQARSR